MDKDAQCEMKNDLTYALNKIEAIELELEELKKENDELRNRRD